MRLAQAARALAQVLFLRGRGPQEELSAFLLSR